MTSQSWPDGPLSDEALERMLAFIGYGNLKAPVWFLGMEEGGGSNERLLIQSRFAAVEDLRDAHVNKLGINRHHEGKKVLQRTWNAMCHIMLSLHGTDPDTSNRRQYQAHCLGTTDGETLLAELMPVAKPSINAWQTDTLLTMFRDRNHYYEQVMPARILLLRELVQEHEPRLIVAYGRSYWKHYEEILDRADIQDHGQMRYGSSGRTTMILTHHFAAKTMNRATPDVVALINQLLPDLGPQLTTEEHGVSPG